MSPDRRTADRTVDCPLAPPVSRDLAIAAVVVGWVGLGLLLDGSVGIWGQRAVGVATWVILVALLRGEAPGERAQVAAAVLFATAGEYVLSSVLGLYTYRLANLPSFVPPGHGLVYLGAIALGRSTLLAVHRATACRAALIIGGAWAAWGFAWAARGDALGGLLFVVFALFVLAARAPLVYAAAFVLTTYLELVGTAIGNWTWTEHVAGGLLSVGNPPSGVPGVYCVLDAIALAVGPMLMRLVRVAAVDVPAPLRAAED